VSTASVLACACFLLSITCPAPLLAGPIPTGELHQHQWSGGVIDNAAFTPDLNAAPAKEPFLGTLALSETPMASKPDKLASGLVLGRDPGLFPGVAVSFFTDGGDLVPFTQELIPYASADRGKSYWDVLVQPGRVWSEPGDGGWSRAAFPFALVNSIEGETHNGLALFLYRGNRVSNLRFQIVQQTAPYYIKDPFVAAGLARATLKPAVQGRLNQLRQAYAALRANEVPVADWSALAAKVGADKLAGFDGAMRADLIVLSGIDYQGTFYLKECRSAAGPLPWCDRARFGVWSATKALANESALLRPRRNSDLRCSILGFETTFRRPRRIPAGAQ
jgi:hypothetical protein